MWFFISTACCVLGLGGLAIAFLGVWSGGDVGGIVFGTMSLMLAVVAVALTGIAYGVVGWGLWQLKPWARSTAMVLAALQLIVVPFGTVAGIWILVYLSRNKEAKQAFGIQVAG
jgi:hypothetical protein